MEVMTPSDNVSDGSRKMPSTRYGFGDLYDVNLLGTRLILGEKHSERARCNFLLNV